MSPVATADLQPQVKPGATTWAPGHIGTLLHLPGRAGTADPATTAPSRHFATDKGHDAPGSAPTAAPPKTCSYTTTWGSPSGRLKSLFYGCQLASRIPAIRRRFDARTVPRHPARDPTLAQLAVLGLTTGDVTARRVVVAELGPARGADLVRRRLVVPWRLA